MEIVEGTWDYRRTSYGFWELYEYAFDGVMTRNEFAIVDSQEIARAICEQHNKLMQSTKDALVQVSKLESKVKELEEELDGVYAA